MIKVLHIVQEYLPATQQWLFNLLKHQDGIELHIGAEVYLDHEYDDPTHFKFVKHDLSSLELLDRKTSWKPSRAIEKLKIKAKKTLQQNPEVVIINYIKKHKIDSVHVHFANIAYKYSLMLEQMDIHLISSFYGWDYEMLPQIKPEWREKYKVLFENSSLISVEGPHGKKTLINMGCDPSKIKVRHLGIETKQTQAPRIKQKSKALNLLQIASFTSKKGQLESVKAFAEAYKSNKNIRLKLIGDKRDPEYFEKVEKYIEKSNLMHVIEIESKFLDYNRLEEVFEDFDVFIHPSQYGKNMDCEGGAPTILFDAMLAGLPIISTTHCDIPNVVTHQVNALLSDEKNTASLAENILTFSKMSEDEYAKMSRSSQEQVKSKFNIKDNALRIVEDYYSLVKDKD